MSHPTRSTLSPQSPETPAQVTRDLQESPTPSSALGHLWLHVARSAELMTPRGGLDWGRSRPGGLWSGSISPTSSGGRLSSLLSTSSPSPPPASKVTPPDPSALPPKSLLIPPHPLCPHPHPCCYPGPSHHHLSAET